MVGLVFAKRVEDEHWWDADPFVRARQQDFERKLDELIEDYGVTDPRLPQQNGDSNMNPYLKLALQVGVPAVIALFLVMQLATKFDAKLDANTEMLRTHTAMTSTFADRLTRTDALMEKMVALTFVQCANSAKTQQERNDCGRAAAR